MTKTTGIHSQFVSTKADYSILDTVAGWINNGKLQVRVGEVLPLTEAAKAHETLEKSKLGGKIILEP